MGKRLGIALLVLAVLLVAADRGAQMLIERVVAGELQESMRSPGRPVVDIAGIPFLPQLISRDFAKVTLSVRDADAGGVKVARVDAELAGVKQQGGGARVDDVTGNGLITYDALTRASRPLKVSYGGEGLVQVSAGAGRLTASAAGRPKIVRDELVIKPERVDTSFSEFKSFGEVPTINVRLRDIPENLEIDIEPTEQGVEFTFSGRNVLFKAKHARAAGPAPGAGLAEWAARPVGSRG